MGPHASAASAGLAVTTEHFDAIRKAWGDTELSKVPEDIGVDEFELVISMPDGSTRVLDILRGREGRANAISACVKKSGEGVQQVEV